ncbi:MAG TPA: hypothetical protein VJ898_06360, partial [Natrialbaceae archaeon]|nr:hypothetical protein [Natrialbaceae archaeon]
MSTNGTILNDPNPLDFDREKEEETESWQRAREDDAAVLEETESDRPGEYRFAFASSEEEYLLRLVEYNGQEFGLCTCKGY